MAQFSVNPQRFDPYKNFTVGTTSCAGHDLRLDRWVEEVALLVLRYYLAPLDVPETDDAGAG